MSNISTYFEKGENPLKFCVGPTSSSPGPILLIVAVTAVKLVIKSFPSSDIRRTDEVNIIIKEINEEDVDRSFEETKSTKEIKINKKDNFNDSDLELKAGDHVSHNMYGDGIVISIDKSVATIAFKNGIGIKKILTTYKKIKKI